MSFPEVSFPGHRIGVVIVAFISPLVGVMKDFAVDSFIVYYRIILKADSS